ncbi:uncharacterized protein GGS25DRAFT_534525 [Hypoxylon fragiforme]|uniref:uncharacterized protein n=1 Tax=Hypoxylon fragiforme TaxID=63214 RepID=UPI0020C62002|nr:uncharacterized protein GGS25DRAFT_534525 [Hypoxylon fragiforme]KAI2604002.1 hypothetical protein GGS25DRAFT_534525 [Hypoxylon fragiforme]
MANDEASPTTAMITGTTSSPSHSKHRLLIPDPDPEAQTDPDSEKKSPLIICFHGSGESCSPSWDALAHSLSSPPHRLRVLLYDRGEENPKPPQATAGLCAYLRREGLAGPYVLVAHSYGGAFARMFLERATEGQVGGMVMVETGQEGGVGGEGEERQYRDRVLGMRLLSVVKGDSFIAARKGLEAVEAVEVVEGGEGNRNDGGKEVAKADLRMRREMLRTWDGEDERLKKRQLMLSRKEARKRFVRVAECGHHVVRDRPDVVVREVLWVLGCEEGGEGEGDEDETVRREYGEGAEVAMGVGDGTGTGKGAGNGEGQGKTKKRKKRRRECGETVGVLLDKLGRRNG